MNLKLLIAFLMGTMFALGLGISGMTQPQKVISFLDIFGNWNPALAFVMLGAIGFHSIFYPLILKRSSPLLDEHFHLPSRTDLEPRLLAGAALFGIGWGLSGFCPGPALTSLVTLDSSVLIFVGSMIAGMLLFRFVDRFSHKRRNI